MQYYYGVTFKISNSSDVGLLCQVFIPSKQDQNDETREYQAITRQDIG
jgi:hypothetical protein